MKSTPRRSCGRELWSTAATPMKRNAVDLMFPVAEGAITREHFRDELGEVDQPYSTGPRLRRSNHDVPVGRTCHSGCCRQRALLVRLARERGVGTEVAVVASAGHQER